jgi:hypothetical protein
MASIKMSATMEIPKKRYANAIPYKMTKTQFVINIVPGTKTQL